MRRLATTSVALLLALCACAKGEPGPAGVAPPSSAPAPSSAPSASGARPPSPGASGAAASPAQPTADSVVEAFASDLTQFGVHDNQVLAAAKDGAVTGFQRRDNRAWGAAKGKLKFVLSVVTVRFEPGSADFPTEGVVDWTLSHSTKPLNPDLGETRYFLSATTQRWVRRDSAIPKPRHTLTPSDVVSRIASDAKSAKEGREAKEGGEGREPTAKPEAAPKKPKAK